MALPRRGTLQRAVHDAMHARWCVDPEHVAKEPGCRAWHPDKREQQAAIDAVRAFDNERFQAALVRELGTTAPL